MRERDTIISVNICSDEEGETNNDESGINEIEGDNNVEINTSTSELKDGQNSVVNSESSMTLSEEKISRKKAFLSQKELSKTNMRKRKQPTESASATLMDYILRTKEKSDEKETEHDGLDHFFLSIASTVRNFTPYNQNLAKAKIFSIVSDLELKELKPCQEQLYQSGNKTSSGISGFQVYKSRKYFVFFLH